MKVLITTVPFGEKNKLPLDLLKKSNIEYLINPLEISLKYVLRGEENLLNLTVYGGVVDYLKELPRSIYYSGKEIPQRIDFKLLFLFSFK